MSTAAQDEFNALANAQHHSPRTHPEDASSFSDNDGTTLHSDHTDEPQRALSPRSPSSMPSMTYTIPNNVSFNANTGPKGVIADARSFETAKKRSFRQTLQAFSNGQSPPLFGRNKKNAFDFSREKSPSPDMSADDDDDFMRTWRQNRLDELASMKSEVSTKRRSPSKRKYGGLVAVDPSGYLDAVEKVASDTIVVVLIYDHESLESAKVEDALDKLAQKYNTTRFVKLHQIEAEMDEIAVPGILAYKGGECFANLVSLVNEMPASRDMNQANLEWLLQQHKILL
ncbi:MAG: hypothetical protein HETSPECPRED_000784 [Heterodermia speciosa]|uniref:Phosducin domain-containing protein n=1 Tax=Heterodermia speciosa TaxID=116794 RepID=A0A8H3GAX1_9LECA|nr:MAG: hypothetical protein HETSPECPRED_000784 [Heterodermia speciosa]